MSVLTINNNNMQAKCKHMVRQRIEEERKSFATNKKLVTWKVLYLSTNKTFLERHVLHTEPYQTRTTGTHLPSKADITCFTCFFQASFRHWQAKHHWVVWTPKRRAHCHHPSGSVQLCSPRQPRREQLLLSSLIQKTLLKISATRKEQRSNLQKQEQKETVSMKLQQDLQSQLAKTFANGKQQRELI